MNVQISPCAFRCKKAKRIKCLNLRNKCLDPYCKYQPFNLKQNMCTVIMSRVLSLCSKVIGHIYIRSSSVKIFNILFSESLQASSALTYEGFFFAVSLVFIGWLSWPMKDIPSLHHEKLFCCVFAKQFAKWWNVWWIWLNWSTKNTFVSPAALSDYILSFFFPIFEVYQCCAPFNKPSEVH